MYNIGHIIDLNLQTQKCMTVFFLMFPLQNQVHLKKNLSAWSV